MSASARTGLMHRSKSSFCRLSAKAGKNQKIHPKYMIARFQILLALRFVVNTDAVPPLNSKHIDAYCERICTQLWDSAKAEVLFERAVAAIDAVAGKSIGA